MHAMHVTDPRRPLGPCPNTKPESRLHVLEETPNEVVPSWSFSPFMPESDVSELDDANVAIHKTFQPVTLVSSRSKPSLHDERMSRLRPAPIYEDKRVEECWAFMKGAPEIQTNQLPSLSRCPSLMSRVSSRNSSTRSTRSSVWDPADNPKVDMGGMWRGSGCSDLNMSDESTQLLLQSGEHSALRCPINSCSKRFTRPANRMRHVFRHYTGVLHCGFCTDDEVAFSQSADRVGLFMTHLLKQHGVSGQLQDRGLDVEKLNAEVPERRKRVLRPNFEGPVANCSVCTEPFSAQGFYEHLRGCIFREITRNEDRHDGNDVCEGSQEMIDDGLDLSMEATPEQEPLSNMEMSRESRDAFEYTPYLSLLGPLNVSSEIESEEVSRLTVSSRCLSLTSSKAAESSEEETDWTEEQTSRESSPGTSQLPRRLSPAKRKVVETIMQEFQRLFSQSLRAHTSGEGAPGATNGGWSSNASSYSISSFVSRKRSLSGGGPTPPDEDGDSNKRRRPHNKIDDKSTMADIRFACPYYKRNPGRHQTFTSCRDPGFTTVARLKEHLYRRHVLPPQCHRCCTTFSNDVTLREHQRDPKGCDVREQVPLEGFDKEQERRLKSKKKSQVHQTEEEKWKSVFRVLFPDDGEADIPTPYIEYQPCTGRDAEPSNIVRFQEFSRLELPRLVRRTLEGVVEQEAQPLEDKVKERLVDIVKECQNQLLSMFQTMNNPITGTIKSINSVEPAKSVLSPQIAGPPIGAMHDVLGNVFETFDSLPTHAFVASQTAFPSEFQMTGTAPKVPTSSNSSDSGYDSTWLPPQAPEANANSDAMDFSLAENPTQHDYLGLDGYFGLFENRMEPTLQHSNSMVNADLCSWSFIEQMSNIGDADATGQEPLEGVASDWHL